jgi:AraC-like DNA-binding protein
VFLAGCEHRFVPDEQSSFLVADMDELPVSLQNLDHPIVSIPPVVQSFCCYAQIQLERPVSAELYEIMGDMFMSLLKEQTFMPRVELRIAKVLEYLEQDLSMTPSLLELANVACLSVSQLKKLFKKETSKTTSQYLLDLRMVKARGLLAHTDTPIGLIANLVGYQDISTFSHRFSAYFGHSPRNSRHQ